MLKYIYIYIWGHKLRVYPLLQAPPHYCLQSLTNTLLSSQRVVITDGAIYQIYQRNIQKLSSEICLWKAFALRRGRGGVGNSA